MKYFFNFYLTIHENLVFERKNVIRQFTINLFLNIPFISRKHIKYSFKFKPMHKILNANPFLVEASTNCVAILSKPT